MPIEVAVAHAGLAGLLSVETIPEAAFGIVYRGDLPVEVLVPGVHAYFRGPVSYRVEVVDASGVEAPHWLARLARSRLAGIGAALRTLVRTFEVPAGHRGLLLVDGDLHAELAPGSVTVFDGGRRYELRTAPVGAVGMEVNGQEILTRDRVAVRINFHLRYRVADVRRALLEVVDYAAELRTAAALAPREYAGTHTLDELLAARLGVDAAVAKTLAEMETTFGLRYVDGGLRDVILPGEMCAIMNRVLVAEKTAEANAIISRRKEAAATRTTLNAAKLMDEHPMLRRLKEMEYVERVVERVDRITLAGGGDVIGGLRALLVPEDVGGAAAVA